MTVKTNQPTKVPALPSVPQTGITPELTTYLRNLNDAVDIRLGRKGDARDRAVTLRELIEGGIVLEANSGAFNTNIINGQTVGMGPTTAPELPITPTQAAGLNVAPLYSQLYLTWDSPTYLGHLFTEIYRHTADVLGDAEFLTYAVGAAYVDPVGGGQTFYYWIRHVSNTGNVGQWNAAAGTVGTTPTDVSVLLSRLNGALSESELAAALTSRINLIDASGNVNGSVAQRIAAEATARTGAVTGLQDQINTLSAVADWDSTVAYSNNDLAVYGGNLYKALASSTNVQPDTDDTKWQDLGAYSSLAEVVAANEAAITQLNTVTSGSTSANALALASVIATTGTNTGAINELNNVSADSTSATALRMFELQAIVDAIDAPQWAHESISTSYAVGDVVISGLNNSAVWSYGANIPAALDIIYDPIQRAIEIPKLPGGDVSTGITFDAFDIGDALSFTISFDVRGDEDKGSGLYARVYGGSRANVGNHAYVSYSLDADNTLVYQAVASDSLPITGLSYASATGSVEDEAIFAAWTNCSFTVTPSSGKEDWLYSLSVLNWTGNASNSLYLRNIKITENLAAGATGRSWDYSSRARKCVAAHSAKSIGDSDYWEDIGSARSALETSRVQGDIKSLNDISATSDSVNARAIKQVSAMLGGSGSTIEQLLSSTASPDGLNAQYTLKIDNNGAVSGFGLSSQTNTANVNTTEFIINADKFQVIAPTASDLTNAETFFSVVTADVYEQDESGNNTSVVSVPAGVYMDDAFIKNASITGAKIGNAAIDSAQIADAAINNAKIGGTIQSENWNDATKTGWKIDKATDTIDVGGINIWNTTTNPPTAILASGTTVAADILNSSQTWSDVTGAGRPADDATRNVFRGAYNSSTNYVINDMVVYSGQVYICIQAGSGNAPSGTTASTGYWSIFSERGEQGEQGLQGPVGTAGTSTYFHIAYATSASGDGFDTANSSGKTYIGTYVDSNASDASGNSSLWNWSLIQGPQGVAGPTGAQGSILYTWIRYADDSSGGGISDDPDGKEYIGFSYNNTSATESDTPGDYTWSLIQGAQGNTGVQGPQGPTGQASYTWIKYAANANGTSGFNDAPQSNTEYIGIATNKTSADESTTPGDYTWSKFKGDTGSQGLQGDPGATGLPGTNGVDGTTYYLHIAYATSDDGSSGFSVSDATNKTYIGQYVDTTPADSSDRTLYSWSLIKGEDGRPASTNYAGESGSFENSPSLFVGSGSGAYSTEQKWKGSQSLKLTATASQCATYISEDTSASLDLKFPIAIPARQKWVVSAYVYLDSSNAPNADVNFESYLFFEDSSDDNRPLNDRTWVFVSGPNEYRRPSVTDQWVRVWGVADCTGRDNTRCRLRVDNRHWNGTANTSAILYVDGVQIELDDGSGMPSAYSDPVLKGADGADGTDGALGGGLDFGFTNAAIDATGAVSKTTTSTSYDSSIYTNNAYTSGCFLTFKTLTNDVSYMVALNDNPSSSSHYSTLDYAWWLSKNGVIHIYESGAGKAIDSGQPNTYAVGDIFSITYDNDKIRYLHNGVVKRTVAANTDRTFHFDSTLQQNSSSSSIQGVKVFTNIAFGPQGQAGVSESTVIGTDVDWVTSNPMSSVLGDWKRQVSFGTTPAITPSGPGFDGGPFGDSSNLGLRFNGRGTSEAKGWQARVGYHFSNNKNSTYWFTCFVKRRSDDTDPADTLKTGFYTGVTTTATGDHRVIRVDSNSDDLDGNPHNPYFHPNFGINEFPDSDKWYLVVGVVHPHDYAGAVSGVSGVYDLETGAKVPGQGASHEWKWVDSYTKNDHYWRLGFYTTDTTYGNAAPALNAPPNRGYIVCRPSIYITDGTQPDLQSIMNNNKVAITPQNIGTYIQDASIQSAQIGNAAITNAKIGNIIQSTVYQSDRGWIINKNGDATFQNVSVRGQLRVASLYGDTAIVYSNYNNNYLGQNPYNFDYGDYYDVTLLASNSRTGPTNSTAWTSKIVGNVMVRPNNGTSGDTGVYVFLNIWGKVRTASSNGSYSMLAQSRIILGAQDPPTLMSVSADWSTETSYTPTYVDHYLEVAFQSGPGVPAANLATSYTVYNSLMQVTVSGYRWIGELTT